MLTEQAINEHIAALMQRETESEQAAPRVAALLGSFLINQQRQAAALERIAIALEGLNAEHGAH